MGCVNKSSREFIQLARRHNLDHNTLELITHKYWLERGSEELFPSDVYIQAQLGNTQYLEAMPTVRDLWQRAYKEPKTFSSDQEYKIAWIQASTYFPKEAIVHYKDANGNFVMKVRQPVEKLGLFDGKMSPVLDSEGHIIPAITAQEERDYVIIARQTALNSEKSANFAPSITQIQELNQKVLSNLEQELQLDKYESRPEGNATTVGNNRQAGNGGLLGESQARIKGRDGSLREVEEQRVLTPKEVRERNAEDKAALEKLAKEQGRWRDHLIDRLEQKYGKKIGKGSEAFAYREEGGPVIKARTIDPDVEGSYNSIEDALASIEIHNRLFPETAMKIIGYGEDEGEFNVIIQQPYIEGRYATQEEIDQFIQEKFQAEKDLSVIGDTSFKTAAYLLQDLKPQNVIVRDGKLYVIDGDFYLTEQHKQYLRLQEKQKEAAKPKPKQPSKKERQVIGPQPFTFNDGTTVTVPFKPNEQQAEALNQMNDFIHSNETSMTLSGYAGTGKTSLMEIIAQKMRREHKPVTFSATTNKAAAVLKARVSKAGFDAQTLNKVFGINVEVDSTKAYNARNLVTALKEADIFPGTAVIIDEASMINEENYRILNKVASDNDLKIIYVGDKAQLAPVNETQVSKVFRNTEGRVIELTQVERTDDNAILKEATALRNGQPLSGESSFNEKGEGVGYLTPKSREEVGKVIRHYIQGLKDNPNFFRILAYTNKAVTSYNNFVRSLLGYTDPIPRVGEPLTGYTNWGYDWRTKTYRFINSESYKVTQVGLSQQISISVSGQSFTMQYVPVTMENSLGERDTFNYMDIKGNQENRQAALMLANQKKTLWEQYRRAVGREAKRDILQQINSIDQFLFVNDNVEDSNHNLLQPKTVDFGYALTIHKSQGSTFTHVLMDDIDVSKASSSQNNMANAVAIVDLKDAGQIADATMEIRSSEDVDLGDLSAVPIQPTSPIMPTVNIADVRQQLRYVGVSRATDTVTIVSDKVKKESSPLNPQAEITINETATPAESRSNNKQETNEEKAIKASGQTFVQVRGVLEQAQRGSNEGSRGQANESQSLRSRVQKEAAEQNRVILNWSDDNGHTIDEPLKTLEEKYGKSVGGSEARVWRSIDGKAAIKSILPNHYANLGKLLERILIHNMAFPNTAMKLTGIGAAEGSIYGSVDDVASFIVEQPWVEDSEEIPTYEEIEKYMTETLGFIITKGKGGDAEYVKDGYMVTDIRPENVIKQPNGELAVIDCFAAFQDTPASYDGLITPDDKTIFVFGSNPEGRHGAGAAKVAKDKFGAIYGQGEGLQGNSYALPTKDLRVTENKGLRSISPEQITENIRKMYEVAEGNPDKLFKVAYTNGLNEATLNGYTGAEMIKMFKDAGPIPPNVVFSKNWTDHWQEVKSEATIKKLKDAKERREALSERFSQEELRTVSGSLEEAEALLQRGGNRATSQESGKAEWVDISLLPIEGTPAETPQQVSLPSYEYFMDRYEDTTIDAAWKIPLLQQLDEQLTAAMGNQTDGTFEASQDIADKMTRILEAKSQEDLLDLGSVPAGSASRKQVEQNLTEFEKMTQQINNLLDSNIISASEIRHIAELVINSISDTITILQKEDGAAEKFFPNIQTDLDFQTASRKEIVEAIGINNLIHRAKLQFDPEQNDYEDFDQMEQADLIIDNWEAIMTLASDIFAMNEGFGITRNYDKGGFATTTQNTQVDFDNFNDYHNDAEAVAEEKDEQEHWQVEQRTIDVLNSMSQLVRLALHECYQTNKDGSKVMSKWGIAERVNLRQAVNSILRWTQGALTLEDMISRMSDKAIQNPWINQLVERLGDKSGKETDFQSQFFGVFSKHFQPYSVVLLEDGKYHSIPVNSHPALSEAMQTITAQFKMGEHTLFNANGRINAALLGSKDRVAEKDPFTLHKALSTFEPLVSKLLRLVHKQYGAETLTKEETISAITNLVGVSRIIGYNVTESMLEGLSQEQLYNMMDKVRFLVNSLDKELQAQRKDPRKSYNPFAFGTDNSIGGTLRNFLTPITDSLEDTAISAFYDSGKMYQSYVTPSYMTKLMNKFRLEGQEFEDFIMREYGSSEWFNAGDTSYYPKVRWRNEWLRWLGNRDNRKNFEHKVELNFNKHNYMRNMSDAEYTLSLITEYFSSNTKGTAWYRIPMLSNKPSSEFLKGPKYEGMDYKDTIIRGLHQMFNQELSRIQTVLMRNHTKNDPQAIKNFDTNGREFNFLPFLNQFLDKGNHSELARLLQCKVEGISSLKADEEARLSTLIDQAIRQHMEDRVARILNEWENNGILEAAKNIKDIHPAELKGEDIDRWVRSQIENFLWNDAFASKNILQLTITDIAFYKDAEDLQKRLAQIHAPGIRGNVAATDYEGNRVSDGTYRTFILQDFDSFKSNIIANISEVFDRRIAAAPESEKEQMMALKESLIGKDGKYTKINVTDAQGYSSPASYRKKAFIFGRWSRHAEDIYQKLQKGEYNYTDLETAFQPLKPFVYSHLQKNMGVSNAPIQRMPVPFQAKNAEYLLIMADAILQGEELSRPNLLRAVYRVMEDSEQLNPTKGIDTVQFESAIKSGLQGRINIHQFLDTVGGEEAAYTYMMKQLYQNWFPNVQYEAVSQLQYNTDTFVHEASYEDYCLQQEVPEHFKNHAQAHGSQIRMITPSDLDFYKNPNGDRTAEDNQVFYEWTEPDGTKKKVRADEFRKEYEQTIAQNISESIDALSKELHIDSSDKKERNIALSKILQREILSSPRYGIDLIQACSIDRETGEFRIPKGDPIQAKRIEQLINSIIKNRVNKQKIAGGPIVQVSNFGTSRQLHIRFNDKNGNLLMTREEYEKNPQKKELSQTDKFKARYGGVQSGAVSQHLSYEEYVKENQGGIAYFEVFIPIWANEIFEKFSNEDGTINMEAIEATDPELLKMVSYRIPTEDKYSCAPMKVVGFMPREAGDVIMLPYELTEIDDSDFDVDKRYVMRKNIPIVTKDKSEIRPTLIQAAMKYKKLSERFKGEKEKGNISGKSYYEFVKDQVNMFLNDPMRMRHSDNEGEVLMKGLYSIYQKIAYTTEPPKEGRTYRDNKIVDMTWAVLTNEMTADKILNPGGFDAPKKMGYMVAAYKNPANNVEWSKLSALTIEELKDLSYQEKDLTWADTQVQFYRQNSAAASLIGVFAVNKVAHATLESNDIQIAVDEICGKEPFTIADTEFGGRMFIDAKYDGQGNLIGKTLGSLVSASADAVKDPILNLMNVNMTTAGTLNTMLRLGMSFEDAALFLSQNVIERVLNEFNRENLTNYQPLSAIIDQHLQEYRDKHNITDDSAINKEPLTKEELVDGLLPPATVSDASASGNQHEATEYKVLLAFQKVRKLTDAIRKPTFATRFNSISSAVGPLIIDNLIIEHKMEGFMDAGSEEGTHFYTSDGVTVDIDDIFYDHPVLRQFSRTVGVAKMMFSDMPAGSTGFRNLLATLPEGLVDKVYNDKKLLDNLSNFYQSYLLIASQMVNPANLKNCIEGFPKYFADQKYKEKYPDNALIQAIRMNVSKRTGRPFLSINITGIDEAQKETYRSAWINLHKDNPELSKRLFEYCFFRAGIGFSPKTFMSLVPAYVKERLSTSLANGSQATYVDTYRNFPDVNPNVVIDQWVRNNWDNNKLVPKKGGEGTHYQVDLRNGRLVVRDAQDMADLKGVTYMKTRNNGQTYLWKLIGTEEESMRDRVYTMVKPLGNNGEYMEMGLDNILKPLSDTKETVEDMQEAELAQTSPSEADAASETTGEVTTATEASKDIAEMADLVMKQNPKLNMTQALNQIERMKEKPDIYAGFLVNVFKQKGLNLTKEEALREFKKLC